MNLIRYKNTVLQAGLSDEAMHVFLRLEFYENDDKVYIDSRSIASLLGIHHSKVLEKVCKIVGYFEGSVVGININLNDSKPFQCYLREGVFKSFYADIESDKSFPFYVIDKDVALKVTKEFSDLEDIENVRNIINIAFTFCLDVPKDKLQSSMLNMIVDGLIN
jgi:hypothetical protein